MINQTIEGLGLATILVFIFLAIVLPISAYCAQKWAYKCYKELQKLNHNVYEYIKEERAEKESDTFLQDECHPSREQVGADR